MRYFALLSKANNSSIFGRVIRVKAPFLVPVGGITEGNKEFSFL